MLCPPSVIAYLLSVILISAHVHILALTISENVMFLNCLVKQGSVKQVPLNIVLDADLEKIKDQKLWTNDMFSEDYKKLQ